MRKYWVVQHSNEQDSKALRYASCSRSHSTSRMSFPEAFLPSMKFTPYSRRSPPTTITVRIWSFWTLETSQSDERKGGLFQRLRSGIRSSKSAGAEKAIDPWMHTNFVHCVEVDIPLGFRGNATKFVTREDVLKEL